MRNLSAASLLIILTACGGTPPAPQPLAGGAGTPAEAARPYEMPMDPGQIPCSDLSNTTAQSLALNWAMGQARADVISGRAEAVPDPSVLLARIAAYCQSNPAAAVGGVRSAP